MMPRFASFPRTARAVLALSAAFAAAVPATAAAGVVTVPGQCYVYWPGQGSQAIDVNLTGFAPGQSVRVSLEVKGKVVSGLPSLTADSTGSIVTKIENWTSGLGSGPTKSTQARVVVSDLTAGTELAAADFKVANVGVDVDTAAKRAGVKRKWVISGLSKLGGGETYYAYYFKAKSKKVIGKQRIGKAQDACGYVSAKKVLIPFKKFGTFDVKIQASASWKGDALPWVGGKVTSYRTYR